MNYTQNCHLPQWESGDRVLRTDFNEAMGAADDKFGEIAAALAHCGNCEFYLGSYTGTGENSTPILTFEKEPMIVFVIGQGRATYSIKGAGAVGTEARYNSFSIAVTWGDKSVQFSGSDCYEAMSMSGVTYVYLALLQA